MREIKFRAWIPEIKKWQTKENVDWSPIRSLRNANKEGYVWSQFTGLLDRNGKEIWEGDVVEYFYEWYNSGGMGETKRAVVGWSKENAAFTIFRNMVVVGNIYEHPELLEVTK